MLLRNAAEPSTFDTRRQAAHDAAVAARNTPPDPPPTPPSLSQGWIILAAIFGGLLAGWLGFWPVLLIMGALVAVIGFVGGWQEASKARAAKKQAPGSSTAAGSGPPDFS